MMLPGTLCSRQCPQRKRVLGQFLSHRHSDRFRVSLFQLSRCSRSQIQPTVFGRCRPLWQSAYAIWSSSTSASVTSPPQRYAALGSPGCSSGSGHGPGSHSAQSESRGSCPRWRMQASQVPRSLSQRSSQNPSCSPLAAVRARSPLSRANAAWLAQGHPPRPLPGKNQSSNARSTRDLVLEAPSQSHGPLAWPTDGNTSPNPQSREGPLEDCSIASHGNDIPTRSPSNCGAAEGERDGQPETPSARERGRR